MVNNQTPCVIVKIITEYDYICGVIDYNYIASGNNDYDYLRSCNRLRLSCACIEQRSLVNVKQALFPSTDVSCHTYFGVAAVQYNCFFPCSSFIDGDNLIEEITVWFIKSET